MEYTTLGKTGLRVSVAGLGCGGFSRLGLSAGKTEDEAVLLVREAVDMGVNLIDTAPIYGTEVIVGKALKFIPRQSVVVATNIRRRSDEMASGVLLRRWWRAWRVRSGPWVPTISTYFNFTAFPHLPTLMPETHLFQP
jgi:aryl-alcohol dehydrogenase-like predicted oxidoreductase